MRRNAFTLTELLIAAATTALVAAASATMTSAVANAASQTRNIRATRSAGALAIDSINRALRDARCIGQVRTTAISLWRNDANADDVLNLYETAVIRYDAAKKQLLYEYLEAEGAPPATTVSTAVFTSVPSLLMFYESPDRKTEVWAENVQSLTFSAQLSLTPTRWVQTDFVIGADVDATTFSAAGCLRGSADYLFNSTANGPPHEGSMRLKRTKVSLWTGF